MKRNTSNSVAEISGCEELDLETIDTFGFRLRLAQHFVLRDFNARFGKSGLTQLLWSILVLIDANPGLRQTDVTSALMIRATNLVELLDGLTARGLVLKRSLEEDRRAFGLFLTEEGAAFVESMRSVQAEHDRTLRERLGKDYQVVYKALQKLRS